MKTLITGILCLSILALSYNARAGGNQTFSIVVYPGQPIVLPDGIPPSLRAEVLAKVQEVAAANPQITLCGLILVVVVVVVGAVVIYVVWKVIENCLQKIQKNQTNSWPNDGSDGNNGQQPQQSPWVPAAPMVATNAGCAIEVSTNLTDWSTAWTVTLDSFNVYMGTQYDQGWTYMDLTASNAMTGEVTNFPVMGSWSAAPGTNPPPPFSSPALAVPEGDRGFFRIRD